jgi:hypothetical protein
MLAIPGMLGVAACVHGAPVPPASDRDGARRASIYRERLDALRERLPRLADYAADTIPGFQVACVLDGEVAWTEATAYVHKAVARRSIRPRCSTSAR